MNTETQENASGSDRLEPLVLHLVLTHHWYDEIIAGRKWIEYRAMSDHWKRLIWDRADRITHVRFQRGFKKNPPKMTFDVGMISIGLCPYDGWDDVYYKIAFGNMQND
jgi:hypothetical protein